MRRAEDLPEAFAVLPEYLRDTRGPQGEVNFCDWGLQLTRSGRALKLWVSLQAFGLTAFRAAIEHGLDLAEHAQAVLEASPQWELVTPASLAVVTFRHHRADPVSLVTRIAEDGFAFLSTTQLRGETVLRMCTINPRTTLEDVEDTIHRLEQTASSMGASVT